MSKSIYFWDLCLNHFHTDFYLLYRFEIARSKSKVIVVVKGDLPSEKEIPEAILTYIKAHTYLSWNDSWFWKKLRYALPHKGVAAPPRFFPTLFGRTRRPTDQFRLLHADNGHTNQSFTSSTVSLNDDLSSSSIGFSSVINNVRHNSVSPTT